MRTKALIDFGEKLFPRPFALEFRTPSESIWVAEKEKIRLIECIAIDLFKNVDDKSEDAPKNPGLITAWQEGGDITEDHKAHQYFFVPNDSLKTKPNVTTPKISGEANYDKWEKFPNGFSWMVHKAKLSYLLDGSPHMEPMNLLEAKNVHNKVISQYCCGFMVIFFPLEPFISQISYLNVAALQILWHKKLPTKEEVTQIYRDAYPHFIWNAYISSPPVFIEQYKKISKVIFDRGFFLTHRGKETKHNVAEYLRQKPVKNKTIEIINDLQIMAREIGRSWLYKPNPFEVIANVPNNSQSSLNQPQQDILYWGKATSKMGFLWLPLIYSVFDEEYDIEATKLMCELQEEIDPGDFLEHLAKLRDILLDPTNKNYGELPVFKLSKDQLKVYLNIHFKRDKAHAEVLINKFLIFEERPVGAKHHDLAEAAWVVSKAANRNIDGISEGVSVFNYYDISNEKHRHNLRILVPLKLHEIH